MTEADRIKLDSLQKDPEVEAVVWQILDYQRAHQLTGDQLRTIFSAGIVASYEQPTQHRPDLHDSL